MDPLVPTWLSSHAKWHYHGDQPGADMKNGCSVKNHWPQIKNNNRRYAATLSAFCTSWLETLLKTKHLPTCQCHSGGSNKRRSWSSCPCSSVPLLSGADERGFESLLHHAPPPVREQGGVTVMLQSSLQPIQTPPTGPVWTTRSSPFTTLHLLSTAQLQPEFALGVGGDFKHEAP